MRGREGGGEMGRVIWEKVAVKKEGKDGRGGEGGESLEGMIGRKEVRRGGVVIYKEGEGRG
jgi:hypothetical protein